MANKRYIPDLKQLHASCEFNYSLCIRLFPAWETEDVHAIGLPRDEQMLITVLERNPYTTTLRLQEQSRQQQPKAVEGALPAKQLTVRLYHDAHLAEVIDCDTKTILSGSYRLPNEQMRQPDEKQQINNFLGEWLLFCLQQGFVVDKSEAVRSF